MIKEIKKNKTYRVIYYFLKNIKMKIIDLILTPFSRICNNRVLITSYFGKAIGDNGKYILENLKDSDVEVIWALNKDINIKPYYENVKYVKYGALKYYYYLKTSKIWIDNSRKELIVSKRKNQFYIQTWHGSIPLKKIEKDAENNLTIDYIKIAKRDAKMVDLLISNSKFCTNMYKRAFWCNSQILEVGTPRNDILVNRDDSIIEKVYNYFGLHKNIKIVLYAPTFRNDITKNTYNIDLNKVKKELDTKYNKEHKILLRLHPIISSRKDLFKYDDNILSATDYPDMQELLLATDILITDYSSSMFDYMILKRPIIIYANDYDNYQRERDFYFNLRELPFILAMNNKELIEKIKNIDMVKMENTYEQFFQKLGLNETGQAAKEIVKIINKRIKGYE